MFSRMSRPDAFSSAAAFTGVALAALLAVGDQDHRAAAERLQVARRLQRRVDERRLALRLERLARAPGWPSDRASGPGRAARCRCRSSARWTASRWPYIRRPTLKSSGSVLSTWSSVSSATSQRVFFARISAFIDPDASRMISRFLRVFVGGASALTTDSSPAFGGPELQAQRVGLAVGGRPLHLERERLHRRRPAASAMSVDCCMLDTSTVAGSKRRLQRRAAPASAPRTARRSPCSRGSRAARAGTS